MPIVLASDHRGFAHKEFIKAHLKKDIVDVGAFNDERSDYPDFALKACKEILQSNNKGSKGIFFCASGIGMAMAANRFPYIYAGVVWNADVARMAAQDDKVNVLVIPTDFVSPEDALALISIWLSATFKGGRYQDRIDQVDRMAL